MSSKFKRCFTNSKNGDLSVYCVPIFFEKKIPNVGVGFNLKPFCNATPGSNGVDSINMYVYNKENINGIINKFAYVECDYVE